MPEAFGLSNSHLIRGSSGLDQEHGAILVSLQREEMQQRVAVGVAHLGKQKLA